MGSSQEPIAMEERIIVTIDGREDKLELKSPMIVNGMFGRKGTEVSDRFYVE